MALLPGDPESGTSGFFINQVYNDHLDGLRTVFGDVISDMVIVDWIASLDHVDPPILGLTDIPIYTVPPDGPSYWIYVFETFVAPDVSWIRADISHNGAVDEFDLFLFCSAWMTETELGDLEVIGTVGIDEFSQFAYGWKKTSVWKRHIASDINNSKHIDFKDYSLFVRDWGKKGSELNGDINMDGSCDSLDLMDFTDDWLKDVR